MEAMLRENTTGLDHFRAVVRRQIDAFPDNALVRLIDSKQIEMRHYHVVLTTIFHQTRSGPYTFALAAANCPWRFEIAKEYLLRHAEEERSHWRWVLDDLRSTGYRGPDPSAMHPPATAAAYSALNVAAATAMPLARLAMAAVLEGIGAKHGGVYGKRLLTALMLKPSQATFFISHGETDKTHTAELDAVLESCDLDPDEWATMNHFADVAGRLYRDMYDHEGYE
jgi:hypothetical protein